jgi:phosphoribosyl-AMP cyclohydrolase
MAVVVTGSYARGTADEHSDLDVRAITRSEPDVRYRTWFIEGRGEKPLHVSFGAYSVDYWLGASRDPAWWALGFPVVYDAVYVWATPDARTLLGDDPSIVHPPWKAQVEGFVEVAAKVRRASERADNMGVLLYSRKVAELAPCNLLGLNEPTVVHTLREALGAALALPVAPTHYREDMTACLGMLDASVEEVGSAALRLTRELLVFLRERQPDVDPQPGVTEALSSGTFERHLGFIPTA